MALLGSAFYQQNTPFVQACFRKMIGQTEAGRASAQDELEVDPIFETAPR